MVTNEAIYTGGEFFFFLMFVVRNMNLVFRLQDANIEGQVYLESDAKLVGTRVKKEGRFMWGNFHRYIGWIKCEIK